MGFAAALPVVAGKAKALQVLPGKGVASFVNWSDVIRHACGFIEL
jgi:hypothetical protein